MKTSTARRFTVLDVSQRSEPWFAARLGRVTGSVAADLLANGKGKEESVKRRNLRIRLALERLTNRSLDEGGFQTQAMLTGIEREPMAFAAYEALTGRVLERSGFLTHHDLMAGCSLDGHADDFEGVIEIKCPEHAAHLEVLDTGKVPAKYLPQVTHALWLTGAAWCDFFSFQPDFPDGLAMKLIRVERDTKAIDAYELALALFLSEVELEVDRIRAMGAA